MSVQGSYQLACFAVDPEREWQRLNAQVDLFWSSELELYERLGLRDGLGLLDAGCGPGHLLERLHARFPALRSTGVEPDPALAGLAREVLERAAPGRVQILEQSVTALNLPDACFDFAICRLVLEHVPEPVRAVQEIQRVLKPGGTAVILDNDFDFHERTWPDVAALPGLYGAYARARLHDGGNPRIGRELPGLLKRAGLSEVRLDVLAAHSELTGDRAFFRAEGSGIPTQLVRNGYLEPDFVDRVTEQWEAMAATPGHAIVRILFAASGIKPVVRQPETEGLPAITTLRKRPVTESNHSRLDTPNGISQFIQTVLAEVMELAPDKLLLELPLVQCGVDSLAALRLCNRLSERLGVSFRITDVLDGRSISDLTQEILLRQKTAASVTTSVPIAVLQVSSAGSAVAITRQER